MKLLKFEAAWCQPCKQIKPIVDEIIQEYSIDLEVIDVMKDGEKASLYDVGSLPTLILVDGNKELGRVIGTASKQSIIERLGLQK